MILINKTLSKVFYLQYGVMKQAFCITASRTQEMAAHFVFYEICHTLPGQIHKKRREGKTFPAPNLFEVVNQLRELGTKLLGGQ